MRLVEAGPRDQARRETVKLTPDPFTELLIGLKRPLQGQGVKGTLTFEKAGKSTLSSGFG